jgi:hypothetical protein
MGVKQKKKGIFATGNLKEEDEGALPSTGLEQDGAAWAGSASCRELCVELDGREGSN